MLGANLFPLLEIERKREDAYSKTRKKVTIVAETFYKWTYLSVNVQTPFCSREGAQRTGENHQDSFIRVPPFSRQEFQLPSIHRATRFVQPGE